MQPLRLCPGRSWPRAALCGDAVADLCEHLLPRWGSLGTGCRMAECVLVSVTLNLSLHISEAPPSPGSVSGRLVLGRVCEGGSVSMGRGDCHTVQGTLPGLLNSTYAKSGGEAHPAPQLPVGSEPSEVQATQAYLPLPPTSRSKALGSPTYPSSCQCTANRLESVKGQPESRPLAA